MNWMVSHLACSMVCETMLTPPLHVVSHNMKGLNTPMKRQKVFNSYHSQKMYIVLLQETHLPKRYSPSFLHAHYTLFFLANVEDKMRGVAILFSKNCKFTSQQELRDPEGRFPPSEEGSRRSLILVCLLLCTQKWSG